jgi:hypothetical protein
VSTLLIASLLAVPIGVQAAPPCATMIDEINQDHPPWEVTAGDLLQVVSQHSETNATFLELEIKANGYMADAVNATHASAREDAIGQAKKVREEQAKIELERMDGSYAERWKMVMKMSLNLSDLFKAFFKDCRGEFPK